MLVCVGSQKVGVWLPVITCYVHTCVHSCLCREVWCTQVHYLCVYFCSVGVLVGVSELIIRTFAYFHACVGNYVGNGLVQYIGILASRQYVGRKYCSMDGILPITRRACLCSTYVHTYVNIIMCVCGSLVCNVVMMMSSIQSQLAPLDPPTNPPTCPFLSAYLPTYVQLQQAISLRKSHSLVNFLINICKPQTAIRLLCPAPPFNFGSGGRIGCVRKNWSFCVTH